MALNLTIAGASQTAVGVQRIRAGSIDIDDPINERSTATFEVMSENLGYAPAVGAEVLIYDGAAAVFGGEILETREEPFGNNIDLLTRVDCVGYDVYADRVLVTESIPAGETLFAILTILVGYIAAAPYSVTLHASQENPGPTLVGAFEWDHKPLSACLADLTAATGYVRKIDATKHLRMWDPGSIAAPSPWDTDVTDADTHSLSLIIGRTRADYANRVYVRAGSGTVVRRQVWTSDGTQTDYVADVPAAEGAWYAPVFQIPDAGPGGYPVALEGAEVWPFTWEPATATLHYNYIAPWLYSLAPFDPFTYPLTAGWEIGFTYTAQYPFTVMAEDAADIAAYGLREAVIEKPDIFDKDQATAIATQAISTMDAGRLTLELETRVSGLASGQGLTVDSTLRGVTADFLLTNVHATVDDDGVFRYTVEGESDTTYRGNYLDTYREWSQLGGGGAAPGGAAATAQQATPGPVPLHGSRHTAVDCGSPPAWTPINNWYTYYLKGEDWPVARVRVDVLAPGGSPPGTVTIRLWNATTGTVAGTSAPISGGAWVIDVTFAVTLAPGWNKYWCEVLEG